MDEEKPASDGVVGQTQSLFEKLTGTGELVAVSEGACGAPRGFDWGDASIGSAFGLTLALLGMGVVQIATRRRRIPSPA